MFTDFYSWFTSLGDKFQNGGENEEFVDYYTGYFAETSVCDTIFLTSMCIAAVVAGVYYFGLCNFVFKLAKRWVWFCVLALVFVITFFTTIPQIVGHDADNPEDATGVFFEAYNIESEKLDGTDDDNMREELQQTASDFREQFLEKEGSFLMRESLPFEMAVVSAFCALIFFIILSFLFKRHTTHGAAVPL